MVTAISFYILQINFFLSVKENPEFPSPPQLFAARRPSLGWAIRARDVSKNPCSCLENPLLRP
jgi:hypothetical protein